MILVVAAVAIALSQSVFLAKVTNLPQSHEIILGLLTLETLNESRQPRQEQIFIWHLPVGLLEWSIGLWLGGFTVFLWDVTKMGQETQQSLNVMVRFSCREHCEILNRAV